ncbi:MAG: multidrug effflux MFS transporter [Flavobacteriaceae bacterium]
MPLKPDTLALTALLALMTALGPLSTDMYLPSLPAIARALSASEAEMQLTLSVFLVGMAIGVIGYGPLSDRYGRRPVLLAAAGLFALTSLACMAARSIETLIALRFFQAVGAVGPVVTARAIVRDLYEGPRAGQELARMGSIMGLVPAIAPIAGGVLHDAFGWQANFALMALLGLAIVAAALTALPETAAYRQRAPLTPAEMWRIYRMLARNADFRRYTLYTAIFYGCIFSFISSSSFILQDLAGLTPLAYGFSFTSVVLGYITGTLAGRRMVGRIGIDRTIAWGVAALALGGAGTLAATEMFGISMATILPATAVVFIGAGLALPQAMAGAMTPFPERAGSASSLLGFFQMTGAALLGVAVGHGLGASARPLTFALAALAVAAAALYAGSRRS